MANEPEEFCPYKGLQPYEEADEKYFFGRERDIEIIISNLCASSLTILYGASGVGKSSVLLAGVAPKMRDVEGYVLVVFRNWQDPKFLDALKRETISALRLEDPKALAEIDLKLPLDRFLRKCARVSRRRLLFIFDQFEEYFLYHGPSSNGSGDGFDSQFAKSVNRDDLNVNFLLSLRDDGLSKLDRFQARIPNLLSNLLRLEHLDHDGALSAICEPLIRYNQEQQANPPAKISGGEGYVSGRSHVPSGLVARLLEDLRPGKVKFAETGFGELAHRASEGIETPFLQMVLTRLWGERDRTTNCLDEKTYDRLEGAQNIVRTHLDNVMRDKFADDQQRGIAARLFQYLVTPDNEKIALSQNVLAEWINEPVELILPVINLLSASEVRILRPVVVQNMPGRYEIFHDVLAPAILAWRTRFRVEAKAKAEAAQKIEEERLAAAALATEQRRQLQLARERAETERQRAQHQQELLEQQLLMTQEQEARAAAETALRHAQEKRAVAEALRAEEHIKASRRLGYLSWGLAMMALLAVAAMSWALVMRHQAVNNAELARKGQATAVANASIAEANAIRASENERQANLFAEESKNLRLEGEADKARAEQMKRLADERLAEAKQARHAASVANEQARINREKTETLQLEAYTLNLNALLSKKKAYEYGQEAEKARNLNSLYQTALVQYRSRDYRATVTTLSQAVPMIDSNSTDRAYALTLLGYSYGDLKETKKAIDAYGEALNIFQQRADHVGEFNVLLGLGDAYRSLQGPDNRELAAKYYEQASEGYEKEGGLKKVAEVQLQIVKLYEDSDDSADRLKAEEAYESAIKAYLKAGEKDSAATTLVDLGEFLCPDDPFSEPSDDDREKARLAYRRATDIYKATGDTRNAGETLIKIAVLFDKAEDSGKLDKSYEAYTEAASIYQGAHQDKEAASVLTRLAFLQGRNQKLDVARETYEKAASLFQSSKDPSGAAGALRGIGRLYNCPTCDNTKKATAADYYRRAIALYEGMPALSAVDRRALISSLNVIVRIYDSLHNDRLEKEYEDKLKALQSPK